MKDIEMLLKEVMADEVESRSLGIIEPESIRQHQIHPFWLESSRILGAAACVAVFALSLNLRNPSELDRAIRKVIPSREEFTDLMERSADFLRSADIEKP